MVVKQKNSVLYVLGEGKTGIIQRIDAWCGVIVVSYKELFLFINYAN
tara:strand:- start:320 stop:460 length:141 start_codon:yes stop_codon:yes gene_type:complete